MKREKVLKHLRSNDCSLLREGGRHSMYINNTNGKQAPVPKHPDIKKRTIKSICNQLDIDEPSGN